MYRNEMEWQGMVWQKSEGVSGPGSPNLWSASNISVMSNGDLELRISAVGPDAGLSRGCACASIRSKQMFDVSNGGFQLLLRPLVQRLSDRVIFTATMAADQSENDNGVVLYEKIPSNKIAYELSTYGNASPNDAHLVAYPNWDGVSDKAKLPPAQHVDYNEMHGWPAGMVFQGPAIAYCRNPMFSPSGPGNMVTWFRWIGDGTPPQLGQMNLANQTFSRMRMYLSLYLYGPDEMNTSQFQSGDEAVIHISKVIFNPWTNSTNNHSALSVDDLLTQFQSAAMAAVSTEL